MCNASDYAVGVVLGQIVDKKINFIYYARKLLMVPKETMVLLKNNF
jgi:hypothetical protein